MHMKPMTIQEVAKAVEGTLIGKEKAQTLVQAVTIDSREVKEGSLFVARKGENTDGHRFMAQALENGAAAVISQKEDEKISPMILVEDTDMALQKLAKYYRDKWDIPFIGITGSVGKTTTKDMVASVLRQKYRTHATHGNFNNEWGVPLTLFSMPEDTEVAVVEMGMNHFGEMHRLSAMVQPDIAVISNVGVAHMEFLGSREGILQAKCEIFDFMRPDAKAVLLQDHDLLSTLQGKLKQEITWYSADEAADYYAEDIVSKGLRGTEFTLCTPQGKIRVVLPVAGVHMVQNALAAAAVGGLLGLSLEQMKAGLQHLVLTKDRMHIFNCDNGLTVINDAYNANPVSTKAALEVLQYAEGRKVAILGGMGELGDDAVKMHLEIGHAVAEVGVELLICVGELAKDIARGAKEAGVKQVYCFESQQALWEEISSLLRTEDTVLIKASHSMALEKTAEKIQGVELH